MDEQALDARVESLARDLARTINAGAAESREHLRELAIQLIRDEVQTGAAAIASDATAMAPGGTFNAFGVGIPLGLMGFVLLILFPPVGVLLLMGAVLMMVWGVLATLLARR
jgi:hypothetical protein